MKIISTSGFWGNNNNNNYNITNLKRQKSCSFKAELWQDDYMPDSIFYLKEKRERALKIDPLDFTTFRDNIGCPVTDGPISKMRINSLRYLGNNTYKGGLADASRYVDKMKDCGLESILVLCNKDECNVIDSCYKNGMQWNNIFVPMSIYRNGGEDDFKEFFNWNRFVNVVKMLRDGNMFVGCESGNIRTKRFLHAVQILDPQFKLNLGASDANVDDIILASWIYKGLSAEQKTALNYTKEFEQVVLETLKTRVPKLL